jgi:large subunit ribosomal protein L15
MEEITLANLKPPKGAIKRKKRVGRGKGSEHGKTSCRGQKGQKSRSGFHQSPGFEGGQMPLHRRVPKRGFTNIFRKEYAEVNLERLADFPPNTEVTPELLIERRIVKKVGDGIKVLGKGELDRPLKVVAHRFSQGARKKIKEAGGEIEVIKR